MRRLIKFLHTMGSVGLTGGVVVLALLCMLAPATIDTDAYLPMIDAMAKIAAWIVAPSMVLTIISGLLAMVATPVFQNLGWVWVKAATGILVFQAGLHVLGPIQEEAKRSAAAVAGSPAPDGTAALLQAEANTLWVLFAVSVANIALAVWRPRFPKYPV